MLPPPHPIPFVLPAPDLLPQAPLSPPSHGVWGTPSGPPEADAELLTPTCPACHGHRAPGSPALAHMLCHSPGEMPLASASQRSKLSSLPAIQRPKDDGFLRVRSLEGIDPLDEPDDINNDDDDDDEAEIAPV